MDTNKFIDKNPTLETYWRSVVLLGKNTASYKFSLAKTLLEFPKKDNFIAFDDLAVPFAKNISMHLRVNDRQATGIKNQFLDACRNYNSSKIDTEQLVSETKKHGFRYVFDAFHNVAQSKIPQFFEKTKGTHKGLTLTDNFYQLIEKKQVSNLILEVDSRWNLWETAVSLEINSKLIDIKVDTNDETLFVLNNNAKRVDVTSSRGALSGYQKGKCFYCSKEIQIKPGFKNSCDVDHFFPHMLSQHNVFNLNQVWNLVLACKGCNRGQGGKFEQIPELSFLELLMRRNNYYVESHHPLRETIIQQTGKNNQDRHRFLQDFFNAAVDIIPSKTKWRPTEILGEQF